MNRIQQVLDQKGVKQAQLAQMMGMARSSVSMWCSNTMQPPIAKLMRIAEILECEVTELLNPKKAGK